MEPVSRRPLLTRIIFVYLALQSLMLGVWALFAPKAFYDGFPGMGRAWIAVDGPYNEHFTRDFGALNLALTVLLVAAALTLTRQLVVVASLSALVWGVPHVIYHLFNTDDLSGSDLVGSIGGLVVFAALPVVALIAGGKSSDASTSAKTAGVGV